MPEQPPVPTANPKQLTDTGRDRVYGHAFVRRLRAMGIRDRPIAPRSPWQNGFAERLIGSIRRDCLDHVVVFGERHLRHLLKSYQKYYKHSTQGGALHLSVDSARPARCGSGPRRGAAALHLQPSAHGAGIADETEKWAKVNKAANIKAD
jgi:transposase InsO family protein